MLLKNIKVIWYAVDNSKCQSFVVRVGHRRTALCREHLVVHSLFKKRLLLAGLFISCIDSVVAASATAAVTVNVVPGSSFFVSDSIELNEKAARERITDSEKTDRSRVVLSSINTGKPVVFKVVPYAGRIYDISISSSSTLVNSAGTVRLGNMKISGQDGSLVVGKDRVLVIEGEITRPYETQPGVFIGTTEINLNYN